MYKKLIFNSIKNHRQKFIVLSFYTKNFINKASRLADSLTALNLNHKIYEIPEIHYSKSNKGSNNLKYSMPNLILNILDEVQMPVLYVDSDIVFIKEPIIFFSFQKKNIDFAIYNFLEDMDNEGYLPQAIKIRENNKTLEKDFYFTKVSVPLVNSPKHEKQLLSAGAVAYFSNSKASIDLLKLWLENIQKYPKAVDDQTLDYTYNLIFDRKRISSQWLAKEYCRYNFWIFVDPIINHPDELTYRPEDNFDNLTKKKRYNREHILKRINAKIDKNHFIDIDKKLILKIINNKIEIVKKFNDQIFL